MYRIIDGQIWLDEKFRKLSADAKLVFIYLFSSHHTNVAGLYFMPVAYILADIGMPIPKAENALQELIDINMISRRDEWIFVHGMVKYQSKSPKIEKAIEHAFKKCESDELRIIFAKHFSGTGWKWLPEPANAASKKESGGVQKGKSDMVSQGYRSQEQNQTETQALQAAVAQALNSAQAQQTGTGGAQVVPFQPPATVPAENGANQNLNLGFQHPEKNVADFAASQDSPESSAESAKPRPADKAPGEEEEGSSSAQPESRQSARRARAATAEDRALAFYFLKEIQKIAPSAKSSPQWAEDIRLMRERDGHTHAQIRAMFDWAHAHDFWRANILSPRKLRQQWVTLEAQSRQPPKIEWPDPTDERAWLALAHEYGLKDGYGEQWPSFQRRIRAAVKAGKSNGAAHGH